MRERNTTLDVLRAAAALLVLGRHGGYPLVGNFGWIGVDLFFVLSGYLVSGLLFSEYRKIGAVRPGRFLMRRGFKIYPQFYVFMAVLAATRLDSVHVGWNAELRASGALWSELLFLQSYREGIARYTWSLAVEEHFYIALALGLWWMARRGGANPFRPLLHWIPAIWALVLATRIVTWWLRPDSDFYVHFAPSHLRIDTLLFGVLLSYLASFHGPQVAAFAKRGGPWFAPVSILLLAPNIFVQANQPYIFTFGFTANAIAFTLLMIIALHPKTPAKPTRMRAAMAYLGRISYAFYLWHGVGLMLGDKFGSSMLITAPVALAATTVAAIASTWLIERPFLRLRDRLSVEPSPDRPLVAAPAYSNSIVR